MKNKVIIFIAAVFLIQFAACFCKDVNFFDFTEMDIFHEKDTISDSDTLLLILTPTDITFMASNFKEFGFSNSYATSCIRGTDGMKYPITKVEITSNADFDDNHLAGELLNDLFKLKNYNGTLENDILEMVEEDLFNISFDLVLQKHPNLSLDHIFTIEFTKSNDEKIVVTSDKIIWN